MLKKITIYPIKSCAGIDLPASDVEARGFPLDRRWLIIEENGTFISQRNAPQLGQIKISATENQLIINYMGKSPLIVDQSTPSDKRIEAQIWKDSVQSLWLSSEYDAWFSEIIGRSVHLVQMDKQVHRPLEKESLPAGRTFEVSFADGYPYLLTNQSSLDDLNDRLSQPIPMDRFRSNLVVCGFPAFTEDHWKRIRIGDVEFLVVKPCGRCQVTTIDQKTGESSKEPLKTLASYRKQNGKVMFGMNLVALSEGRIKINTPVHILE
ncbi:MAG: MOSC domain-containing protein [Candidatus Marinimicrobia bacterium]|nr:MOSC domain-containing protein [Candidatus Neomarinimicrobiota bacterium]